MSLNETLLEKQTERATLVQRATELLRDDERIVAAWLAGSLGRGDDDTFSDVDLWVVVKDVDMEAVRDARRQFVEVLGQPVLLSEAPQNAPPGGAYLWALYVGKHGPQHVDWNWLPQSGAAISQNVCLLFDKAGLSSAEVSERMPPEGIELAAELTQACAFFWAMSTVVAKYIARGKPYDVLNMLNIAGDALTKVKWLLGTGARMSYQDNIWDPAPPPFEAAAQLAFLRSLAREMAALHGSIEAAGGTVQQGAIRYVDDLFDLVEHIENWQPLETKN